MGETVELAVDSYLESELENGDLFLLKLTIAKDDKLMRLEGLVYIPLNEEEDVKVRNIILNETKLSDRNAKELLASAVMAEDKVYDISEFSMYAPGFDFSIL